MSSSNGERSLLFYHPNHLGSTDLLTDAAGTQVAHYEYTPYGELFSTEGVSVPHKFTGKELDPETGLYFYEARYYDPQLGRFITADPTIQHPGDPQDFNRYSYARDNPVRYTDPTGLGWNPFKGIAKALGKIGRVVVSAVIAAATFVTVTIATGGNVHLAASFAAASFAYTSTFLNASAQGASLGRAWGAAAVNGLAAFGAVYFGWNAGLVGGALTGAYFGAAGGAASSAILGGSPGTGALSGATGGAIMGGLGGAFGPIGGLLAAPAAGAASAAVAGGNVAQGAYLGAIGAATFAIASASFQAAIDIARAKGGEAAVGDVGNATHQTQMRERFLNGNRTELAYALGGVEGVLRDAFQVDVSKINFAEPNYGAGGPVALTPEAQVFWQGVAKLLIKIYGKGRSGGAEIQQLPNEMIDTINRDAQEWLQGHRRD